MLLIKVSASGPSSVAIEAVAQPGQCAYRMLRHFAMPAGPKNLSYRSDYNCAKLPILIILSKLFGTYKRIWIKTLLHIPAPSHTKLTPAAPALPNPGAFTPGLFFAPGVHIYICKGRGVQKILGIWAFIQHFFVTLRKINNDLFHGSFLRAHHSRRINAYARASHSRRRRNLRTGRSCRSQARLRLGPIVPARHCLYN